MALPLLGVAAMIGRAGIAAAAKKFGKKAVQEAVKKGAKPKPKGATRVKPQAKKPAPKKPATTASGAPRGATRNPPKPRKKPVAGARGATRTGQAPRSQRAGTAPKTTRNRTGKVMAGATAASVAIPMASSVIKGGAKTPKRSRFGVGSAKTITYKGREMANVDASQLKATGMSLRSYMNAWNKTGKRPTKKK